MELSAVGAGSLSGSYMDQQTFGARVVEETIGSMNEGGTESPAPFDAETFGAAVVSKTMDYLNTDPMSSSTDQSYDFQKSVLGAAVEGSQRMIDMYI